MTGQQGRQHGLAGVIALFQVKCNDGLTRIIEMAWGKSVPPHSGYVSVLKVQQSGFANGLVEEFEGMTESSVIPGMGLEKLEGCNIG